MSYPDQVDLVWLASDGSGRVAAMVTGGEGPIPAEVLAISDCIAVEEALLGLSVVGEASLDMQVPNPASFVELGRRGLYVYDWTDVYRPSSRVCQAYELVCSPTVPISSNDLSKELLGLTYKASVSFGRTFIPVIDEQLTSPLSDVDTF